MMLVQMALVLLLLVPVPFVIGSGLLSNIKWIQTSVAAALLAGTLFAWALFEVVTVPLILMNWSLNRLTVIYGGLMALAFLICLIISVKSGELKRIWQNWIAGLKRPSWIGVIAIVLIGFQTAVLTLLRHQNGDDAEYVAMASTAWKTNTLLQIDPYTGRLWEYVFVKRVISPWSLLPAVYAKVTQLHPAIIFHTIYPLVFIPMCYMTYYLLAKKLFTDEKYSRQAPWLFLIFVSVLMMFDGFSTRMAGALLLGRIWQGKGVLCSVILPASFALLIALQDRKTEVSAFVMLFIVTLSGVMSSSMAVVLLALVIGAYALVTLIRERRIGKTLLMLFSCLPCVAAGAMYLFL